MTEFSGHLVLPDGVTPGRLRFGTTIAAIEPDARVPDRYVLPGFIDTHVHGGGGGDVIDGPDGVRRLARTHAAHGTTTLLPTTITRPWPEVMAMLRTVAAVRAEGVPGGAAIVGAHLEGPFISPDRLGAQPPFAIPPEPALVREAIDTGAVRAVTIAPEWPEADAAIRLLVAAGIRIGIGHTVAGYDRVAAALELVRACGGIAAGTHLFNAMGGIAGREPGAAGAVLADPHAFAELILDGHHVHRGAFLLARAALGDRLILITDAMRAAGIGDGPSDLGGQTVQVSGGAARLADGTLAGSVLTMDAALRHAVAAGVGLEDASRLLSANPARSIALTDRGELRPGQRADLVVLDAALVVTEVWVGGERVA